MKINEDNEKRREAYRINEREPEKATRTMVKRGGKHPLEGCRGRGRGREIGDKVTSRRVEKQVKRKEEKKRGRMKDRRKRDINKERGARRIKVTSASKK